MSNSHLTNDWQNIDAVLQSARDAALQFLTSLDKRPAGPPANDYGTPQLSESGIGAEQALQHFISIYGDGLSGTAGPRYWAFVTGGTTPAALVGDWLTGTFDQNAADPGATVAHVELETLAWLRQLFGLSDEHVGAFVTGATMANFSGLAVARQWIGQHYGVDVAQEGIQALPGVKIFSAKAHSSSYKSLAMLGFGRNAVTPIATLPSRESIDVTALEKELSLLDGAPCIVIASAGTVNSVDFDDFQALNALKQRYPFWLHIDAAYGGFAACSPRYSHLLYGWDEADSICIDAHKWLNVPYEAAMAFTRHADLRVQTFRNAAAYLGEITGPDAFVHLSPNNSRRWRALPSWFSLIAYGRSGYREIVERNCDLARLLAAQINESEAFELLTEVRLNGLVFALTGADSAGSVQQFLQRLRDDGRLYLSQTVYFGRPAIRISIVNWRSNSTDAETAWQALNDALA